MTTDLVEHLRSHGVTLRLGDSAESFRRAGASLIAELKSGELLKANFVVLCIGVRPENQLAVDASLQCGERGGICTDVHMQTSDPNIYAVGDAVEVSEFVSGRRRKYRLPDPLTDRVA